jgi:hypothetical protein
VIVPRNPDESELLIRISLPHEDDSFMPPPEGSAQPFDEGELAMMKAWIRNGATFGDWVRFEHPQAMLPHCGVAEERVLADPFDLWLTDDMANRKHTTMRMEKSK